MSDEARFERFVRNAGGSVAHTDKDTLKLLREIWLTKGKP